MTDAATTPEAAPAEPITLPDGPTTPVQKRELGELLNQFESSVKPVIDPTAPINSAPAPNPRDHLEEIQRQNAEWSEKFQGLKGQLEEVAPVIAEALQRQAADDVAASVKTVKSQLGMEDIPAEKIERDLFGYAAKNPEFNSAWDNRESDPSGWASALRAAGQEIGKSYAAVNRAAEERARRVVTDLNAAASAVRNVHNGPMPAPTFDTVRAMRVSDAEYDQMVKDYLAAGGR